MPAGNISHAGFRHQQPKWLGGNISHSAEGTSSLHPPLGWQQQPPKLGLATSAWPCLTSILVNAVLHGFLFLLHLDMVLALRRGYHSVSVARVAPTIAREFVPREIAFAGDICPKICCWIPILLEIFAGQAAHPSGAQNASEPGTSSSGFLLVVVIWNSS